MNFTTLIQSLPPVSFAVFVALGMLSVLALTVAVFKTVQFARIGVGRRALADEVLDDWLEGRADDALDKARARPTVLTRVLAAVISGLRARPEETEWGAELGRQVAMSELGAMCARMRLLEAVVQGAPMLGLLGTVVGMIDAFGALSSGQQADPQSLASGILTALTTTAAGLAIALLAYFVSGWLESRIEAERQAMEISISAAIHGRPARTGPLAG
ncbi:MotA/TolQ/ExbB proton channel family protein [Paracoccus jiaweipingae]|uniref:MotA/TolQ/ExbB proton channel family protein n=1 Tax=unclassified Paracoccus (in: a-proteobacteria) TaxID=2688777 RepID=UPI0037B11B02